MDPQQRIDNLKRKVTELTSCIGELQQKIDQHSSEIFQLSELAELQRKSDEAQLLYADALKKFEEDGE